MNSALLQVAARTSAFSFKGKDTDIGTIARKLNVASVLEGSVRRSGAQVLMFTNGSTAIEWGGGAKATGLAVHGFSTRR
jgi:hypothetical protein